MNSCPGTLTNSPETAYSELELASLAHTPSQRHVEELKLFREFRGKPEREAWGPDWTMIY
jgi:hypothetical protein